MTSMPRAAALLALFFALVFPVSHPPELADAAETTTGLIVGTVTSATGTPIARATVTAAAPSGRYTATTDARGRFVLLGVEPDTYTVTAEAPGYQALVNHAVRVITGQEEHTTFALATTLRTIGDVQARTPAFSVGSGSDSFVVSGAAARAQLPTTSSAGLGSYTQGTVQGAIANVPGVALDPFANAILRAGRVNDTVFDFDSVPIPQGLIAEPGGNVDGAQLPTTGIASTSVILAGYSNESDNALGGVVNQIPAVGTYPGSTTIELADGIGAKSQFSSLQFLGATPDLKWRYAFASTFANDYLKYGYGNTFYAAEAATYGLSLQTRGQYSVESNIHYAASSKDDLSVLALVGQAEYNQYGSP